MNHNSIYIVFLALLLGLYSTLAARDGSFVSRDKKYNSAEDGLVATNASVVSDVETLTISSVTEFYEKGDLGKAEGMAYDLYIANSEDKQVLNLAYRIAMSYTEELYKDGRFEKVLEVARHASLYNATDYLPYYYRGLSFTKLNELEKARVELIRAKDLCVDAKKIINIVWALANIAHSRGDYSEAASLYQEVLSSGKNTAKIVYRLGDSLWRSGDTARALVILREGRLDFPDSRSILALLNKLERENIVEEDFRQVRSGDFFISFERSDEQQHLKDRLSTLLEKALDEVERNLWSHNGNAIHVVLYPSGKEFKEAINAPNWSGACWNGKLRIPLETARSAREEKLLPLLQHELVHFLLREKYKWKPLPCWLDEGLAQIYEGEEKHWAKNILRPAVNRRNSEKFLFPLKQLEGSFSSIKSGHSARMAYAQALWATKYLIDKRWSYPTDILDYIAEGYSSEEALAKVTGEDYTKFTQSWLIWLRREFKLQQQ